MTFPSLNPFAVTNQHHFLIYCGSSFLFLTSDCLSWLARNRFPLILLFLPICSFLDFVLYSWSRSIDHFQMFCLFHFCLLVAAVQVHPICLVSRKFLARKFDRIARSYYFCCWQHSNLSLVRVCLSRRLYFFFASLHFILVCSLSFLDKPKLAKNLQESSKWVLPTLCLIFCIFVPLSSNPSAFLLLSLGFYLLTSSHALHVVPRFPPSCCLSAFTIPILPASSPAFYPLLLSRTPLILTVPSQMASRLVFLSHCFLVRPQALLSYLALLLLPDFFSFLSPYISSSQFRCFPNWRCTQRELVCFVLVTPSVPQVSHGGSVFSLKK